MIRSDVVDRGVDVGLLQTAKATLQSPHKTLPQIVHGADQLICHRLIQTHHYQLLDRVDAGFDFL